jgi:N-acetyl-anhydromuramyl-L-alanine amidase AmpD
MLVSQEYLLPLEDGQAVSRGWPAPAGPTGVTWHWTATRDLRTCSDVLGGKKPLRKGQASAHYGIGRHAHEGVHQYVALENRSWHAGIQQRLRWDGQAFTGPGDKASRTTVGVETVALGFERSGVDAAPDWIVVDTPDGHTRLKVQPWTDPQMEMMIAIGRAIRARYPQILPEHHHGHSDLCPTYKQDVLGFPFAELLRGIYDDPSIYDVWTPLRLARQRQRTLAALGYDLGPSGADDEWGQRSTKVLTEFHATCGLPATPYWTTFTCRKAHERLNALGKDLKEVAGD